MGLVTCQMLHVHVPVNNPSCIILPGLLLSYLSGGGVAAGRSFDPTELSDSDEEEDTFITEAPPDYDEIVAQPPPVV